MKAKIVLFTLIIVCLLNWTNNAEAAIPVGPYTFEDDAFADNATQLDPGGIQLKGATDLNDALTGYSPTKGLINIGLSGSANFFQLEFTDIIAENASGPDIVLFDFNGGLSSYEIAVREIGGNISNFVTFSSADFVDTGVPGPFGKNIAGLPIDLDDIGLPGLHLPPGAIVDAILFKGLGNPEPSMAGVLNGRQLNGTGFQVTALAPYRVRGGNTGLVATTVYGSGFQDGASVVLTGPGPDIVRESVSVAADGNTISATFNLTDKALGLWDVVVTNPDFTIATLTAGFLVEEPTITIGPFTFGDDAFADNATQLETGVLKLRGGAIDLNDALTGYSPTKGLINIGISSNANFFQLEFTDIIAENAPGPDIVLFDWGGDTLYEIAVHEVSGNIRDFVSFVPSDFVDTGVPGPFFTTIFGLPIELDTFGLKPGAVVDGILFREVRGLDPGDPVMAGVLNPVGLSINATKLSTLQLNVESSQMLEAIKGTPPYSWSVTNGILPTGMSLNSDGSFTGTPTQIGSSTFTVKVTDSNGDMAEKEFTVDVALVLPPPDIRINKVGTVAVPGRVMNYFIIVENIGNVTATDVEVLELLDPEKFTLLSVNPPAVADLTTMNDAKIIL